MRYCDLVVRDGCLLITLGFSKFLLKLKNGTNEKINKKLNGINYFFNIMRHQVWVSCALLSFVTQKSKVNVYYQRYLLFTLLEL